MLGRRLPSSYNPVSWASEMRDLVVIGGGIAGSLVAAMASTVDGAWIYPFDDGDIQSFQWHGYLHRGYLYDVSVEQELIAQLRHNIPFWSSLENTPFVRDARCFLAKSALSHRRSMPAVLRPVDASSL